ncbi:MAG: DNA repair protein RecN [Lachnospiraceae bacterium]|nr:DNA repair protein RecN [Lachnospiraceae bacterium]
MLISLKVQNLALIKESEVFFSDGLNIITGETGTGKSLIIGSVSLALGARAAKDIVRTGEKEARIELVFSLDNKNQEEVLKSLEIPFEEDDIVILKRTIRDGRSIASINSQTVTASTLKAVSEMLLDMHGQHEHQSLLYKRNHMRILDSFAARELESGLALIKKDYDRLLEIRRELEEGPVDERDRTRQVDLLKFEIDEIEKAHLKEGEDDELEEAYGRFKNAERLTTAVNSALNLISSDRGDSAISLVGNGTAALSDIEGIDEETDRLFAQLGEIESLLGDFSKDANNYLQSIDFSREEFEAVETRLDLINRMKAKYGDTFEDIENSAEEKKAELERLSDVEAVRERLLDEKDELESALREKCAEVSSIRKEKAERLSALMMDALQDLNFNDVNFRIDVRSDEEKISETGYDEVEFMISMNKGEPLKSLENVASGGELSRIMLALKTVLAHEDEIHTLIFDEIDTGISGRTAQSVAEKLNLLSLNHQVICITHLPQIAAMADHHFVIEKHSDEESTQTVVKELNEEEMIGELSRLLSGETITDAVRENAAEMRDLAKRKKVNIT